MQSLLVRISRRHAIWLIAVMLAGCASPGAPVRDPMDGFLQISGTQFMLNGDPFFEIGFNKFDLAQQIMADYLPEVFPNWVEGYRTTAATNALAELNTMGFRVIRVCGTPFMGSQIQAAFVDEQNRVKLFQALDDMMDIADAHDIMIVFTLGWRLSSFSDAKGETLRTLITNPKSKSRQLLNEYIDSIVSRYKQRNTIAMWEIANEGNLTTDHRQDLPSSRELAEFYAQVAARIRMIDSVHIIGTGDSAPRPAQASLLASYEAGGPPDWTENSKEELASWMDMIHGQADIDVVGIHKYYESHTHSHDEMLKLQDYMDIADTIGKPLFLGETGPRTNDGRGNLIRGYRHEDALHLLKIKLDNIVNARVPLSLFWTYHMDRWHGTDEWDIRVGLDDAALELIAEANNRLKTITGSQ